MCGLAGNIFAACTCCWIFTMKIQEEELAREPGHSCGVPRGIKWCHVNDPVNLCIYIYILFLWWTMFFYFKFPVAGPENREMRPTLKGNTKKSSCESWWFEESMIITGSWYCAFNFEVLWSQPVSSDFCAIIHLHPCIHWPLPRRYIISRAPHFDTGPWCDLNALKRGWTGFKKTIH